MSLPTHVRADETYLRADGTRAGCWNLQVLDAKGQEVGFVTEVNTAEGWLLRYKHEDGRLVVEGGQKVVERLEGRFTLREVAP